MKSPRRFYLMIALTLVLMGTLVLPAAAKGQTGSIFTTVAGGSKVVTHFSASSDVYLAGRKLPDGTYYVQVTTPDGTVLGKSPSANVTVADGAFGPVQLWALVKKTSDSSTGWDTTTNPGGVYKVWLSSSSDFAQSKTHNFTLTSTKPGLGEGKEVEKDENTPGGQAVGRNMLPPGWASRFEEFFARIRDWITGKASNQQFTRNWLADSGS
ncbi:MAG: hypothetical protein ACYC6L_03610 [Anaerolineae bacterium]